MTGRGSRRIATAMVAGSGLFLVVTLILQLDGRQLSEEDSADWIFVGATVIGAAIYLWIGRAIVTRQPANTIGWLLLVIPTIACFAIMNGDYATHTLVVDPASLPFGRASAWLDRWILIPVLAAFIPLFLLYPDGRLPSGRWRLVGVLTFAAPAVTTVGFAITPGPLTGSMADLEGPPIVNPLGVDAAAGTIDVITQVGGSLILLSAVVALVAIVVRYRGAGPDVRQQIRWLAFVGVAFFAELALAIVFGVGDPDAGPIGDVLFFSMFFTLVIGIPVACGVAILRYRLYDLDVVIRKTVVFGAMAAFIGAIYAAIVGGVGVLVGSRSNATLAFVAAAALAVLFQPVRERVRRFADRIVYGRRATPYEVLAQFSSRMGEAFEAEEVLPRMAEILAQGTGATGATVWLRVGAELRPEASWPAERPLEPIGTRGEVLPDLGEPAFEVRDQEELLGALSVSMPPADPMDPAKERLIRDVAAQAGLVLRNVRLIEELRASRQRLIAAQDEERRRIERNLHDGAQQQLVALTVQLRLAEQTIGHDPDRRREVLRGLQGSANEALEDLRDLARGIYPPVLADQGLAAALEAQARKAPLPVVVDADGIGRYPRPVEAAVYFCVLEALNNVSKYAEATKAEIRLRRLGDHLSFEVDDDGRGFDPVTGGHGTGVQGMTDRLEAVGGALSIESEPGRGTRVLGRIPVEAEAPVPLPA